MAVVLGGVMATVFAIALYAAGQSSAITGVLAGRILTRGFRGRESRAWLRGIVTRVVAVAIGFTLMTRGGGQSRSEEHTPELQSLMRIPYAGFCLQEKKPLA